MSALLACTGALFWLVVYAAAYRGRRQDVRSPEVVHVVFVGVGCVLSGIGLFLLAGGLWGAELGAVDAAVAYLGAAFGCLGMALVAIPIYWSLPAVIAQPTRQECDEARAALQAEIDHDGGKVTLESTVGHGTTVTCVFPVEQEIEQTAA